MIACYLLYVGLRVDVGGINSIVFCGCEGSCLEVVDVVVEILT